MNSWLGLAAGYRAEAPRDNSVRKVCLYCEEVFWIAQSKASQQCCDHECQTELKRSADWILRKKK